jgi:hypothetical protein
MHLLGLIQTCYENSCQRPQNILTGLGLLLGLGLWFRIIRGWIIRKGLRIGLVLVLVLRVLLPETTEYINRVKPRVRRRIGIGVWIKGKTYSDTNCDFHFSLISHPLPNSTLMLTVT